MQLEFKMHQKQDEDLLVDFWNRNSGWGTIEKDTWLNKFMSSPLGPSSFALALDKPSGEIVAQFGFVPSSVSWSGDQVAAYRPVAIMVRKDIRENKSLVTVPKLILQLYQFATRQLERQGTRLIHMVPDHRWARLFKMAPNFKLLSFPLYHLELPLVSPPVPDAAYRQQPMSYDDPAIDELWDRAKKNYPFIVTRDRTSLAWKNSHRPFLLWGLYREEKLVGLFTIYQKEKNRKWQICDVLAEDTGPVLKNLLMAACIEGQRSWEAMPPEERSLEEIELFPSQIMEPIVQELGFQPVKYKFSLVIHQLDKSLPKSMGEAKNWYVSPNE